MLLQNMQSMDLKKRDVETLFPPAKSFAIAIILYKILCNRNITMQLKINPSQKDRNIKQVWIMQKGGQQGAE